jgi:SAM-dependent methyltransferase
MNSERNNPKGLFEDSSAILRATNHHGQIVGLAANEQRWLNSQLNNWIAKDIGAHFEKSGYDNVVDFFHEASKDYDSDLENPYWAFSHEILKFILVKFISEHFADGRTVRVFDAGAGTGNWSKFVLGLNIGIRGIMFDMNPYMLKVARTKMRLVDAYTKIVEGNLENPEDFPSEPSNLVLCMHNVIGLARNTELVLRNLYRYLDANGLAFVMTTNKFHAFNFARRFRSPIEVMRVVKDGTVKFKDDMPEMFCYTPAEFEAILRNAGFEDVTVLGFPVTVYPSSQDTKLLRKVTENAELKNPKTRTALLSLEKNSVSCQSCLIAEEVA